MLEVNAEIDDKAGDSVTCVDTKSGIVYEGIIEGKVTTGTRLVFECKFKINNKFVEKHITIIK